MLSLQSNKKMPLFIISGASGVGKSEILKVLAKKENVYIVLDGDEFCNVYTAPVYFKKVWLDICHSVSLQTDKPVVFCAAMTPDGFGFTTVHFWTVVQLKRLSLMQTTNLLKVKREQAIYGMQL